MEDSAYPLAAPTGNTGQVAAMQPDRVALPAGFCPLVTLLSLSTSDDLGMGTWAQDSGSVCVSCQVVPFALFAPLGMRWQVTGEGQWVEETAVWTRAGVRSRCAVEQGTEVLRSCLRVPRVCRSQAWSPALGGTGSWCHHQEAGPSGRPLGPGMLLQAQRDLPRPLPLAPFPVPSHRTLRHALGLTSEEQGPQIMGWTLRNCGPKEAFLFASL